MKFTKQTFFNLLFFIIFAFNAIAQEKVTLSGTISDIASNETLIGVNVFIKELKTGITTNEYGFYSISVPKGDYTIQSSYTGYQTLANPIYLNSDIKRNIALQSDKQQLKEVVVTTNKRNITNIRKPEMSTKKLKIKEIKKMQAGL